MIRQKETKKLFRENWKTFKDKREKFFDKRLDEPNPFPKPALRRLRARFHNFVTLTEYFPEDILTLEELPCERASNGEIKNHRNRHQRLLPQFLKAAAIDCQDKLKKMGLGEDAIAMMRAGIAPIHPDGWSYDITLDHVVDIALKGKTEMGNIVFVPDYLNAARARLHDMQINGIEPVPKSIISLQYRSYGKSGLTLVPYIEGGFRRFDRSTTTFSERIAELFKGRTWEYA